MGIDVSKDDPRLPLLHFTMSKCARMHEVISTKSILRRLLFRTIVGHQNTKISKSLSVTMVMLKGFRHDRFYVYSILHSQPSSHSIWLELAWEISRSYIAAANKYYSMADGWHHSHDSPRTFIVKDENGREKVRNTIILEDSANSNKEISQGLTRPEPFDKHNGDDVKKIPTHIDKTKAIKYKIPSEYLAQQKDNHNRERVLCKVEAVSWWLHSAPIPDEEQQKVIDVLYKTHRKEVSSYMSVNWKEGRLTYGPVLMVKQMTNTKVPLAVIPRSSQESMALQVLMPEFVVKFGMKVSKWSFKAIHHWLVGDPVFKCDETLVGTEIEEIPTSNGNPALTENQSQTAAECLENAPEYGNIPLRGSKRKIL
ncbi:hypothetical protein LSTR_LSTR016046 [Laodelphax striatellus]|uniref:Uncharacterized protein n=1 Tax=Laodelphax striatellus TaxID=195883 RepID=A0A482WHB9_LAOST|nr:hypothetical protein LSTR_LSTR016046 [Laodelphax striatellus]